MTSEMRNKMYASLGQAYVALGQMQQAVDYFERALEDKTYFLSASASVDYQRAVAAVSQGNADTTQSIPALVDTSGLDVVGEDGLPTAEPEPYVVDEHAVSDEYYFADQYEKQGDYATTSEERFFNSTDQELEQWSKGVVKMERKRRGVGLKIFLVIVLLLLVAAAAGLVLYMQGFGYPTQEATVEQLFDNPASESNYANGITSDDITEMSKLIADGSTITIDGVDKSMSSSTAYVTATTPQGGDITYEVSLVRDMIGWKVSNLELYFASQH